MALSQHLALAACLVAAAARAQAPVTTPFADRHPDLADHSSWAQDATYEGEQPAKRNRGVYPVGNGRVFGYVGLGERANTMQGVSGPSYQTEEVFSKTGHFGEHGLTLLRGDATVSLPQQRVRRVRGANFVVTEDAGDALALRTLSFAPPGGSTLLRVVEIHNTGGTAIDDVALELTVEGEATATAGGLSQSYDRNARRYRAAFRFDRPSTFVADRLRCAVGRLEASASWRTVLSVATHRADAPSPPAPDEAAASIAAGETLAHWRERLAGSLDFDTDHVKLRDLVHDWKVLMLVQQAAESRVVSPMVNYRGSWVRDNNGPMLAFLRLNMWDEAKAILRYTFNAARLLNRVSNHVPLDLDFSDLAERTTDWNSVAIPDSEVPSWVVLQHHWYWRVTRDTELIKAHWPLLQRCMQQRRVENILLPFHGDETWMHGALYSLYPGRVGDDSRFLADTWPEDRRAYSFPSSVLFLLGTQALGELANAIDELDNPERWAGDGPATKPGQQYLTYSFTLMQAIEKKFWLESEQIFAPALSPVNLQPHREPYANANLMPLWVGWTFPTGEKSRDNLRHTAERLWRRSARIGTTPTVGWACGHTQGMLLVALSERDCKRRLDALDELLAMAEPAGEWGEVYDPDGRPAPAYHADWPNRLRPWESGVNLDAILFAISGIRFATIASWDMRDIRTELRLPRGATFVTMKGVRKDGRDLNLYWREVHEKMSDQDRAANAELVPEKRRDPDAVHRRMRFRIDLNSPDPESGYYDVGANAAGTLFVRYLRGDMPIDEFEYWADDKETFLPDGDPAMPVPPPSHVVEPQAGAEILYLASRQGVRGLVADDPAVTLVDTGLPMTQGDLAALLIDEQGQLRHRTLFFDWHANATGRTTFKTAAFWNDAGWRDALAKFAAAGGKILRARFVDRLMRSSSELRAEGDGRFRIATANTANIDAGGGNVVLEGTITATAAAEVVLRAGSSSDLKVELNGTEVIAHRGSRHPLPDQDTGLVSLRAGANALRVTVPGDREQILWLRATDARGLPVDGVN